MQIFDSRPRNCYDYLSLCKINHLHPVYCYLIAASCPNSKLSIIVIAFDKPSIYASLNVIA